MLHLASTMEERCRLMKDKLDATYYEDPMTYSNLEVFGLRKEG